MPPWILAYIVFSMFLSQQWIKTWKTKPEHTVVITAVMAMSSYFAYKAFEKEKKYGLVNRFLPGVTNQVTNHQNQQNQPTNQHMHFLLQHNKRLVKVMNLFTKKYKRIDPGAYTDVMKALGKFLNGYSRLLLKPPNQVSQQDAEDLLEIRRLLLNTLYSFNLKNANIVHDMRFKDIVLTTHSSTYKYLEILRNKHPILASILPPMPRAVEPNINKLTSFDLV